MMDVFGKLLTGAPLADYEQEHEQAIGCGPFVLVFKPDISLASSEEYLAEMDELTIEVRETGKASGVERINTRGEIVAEKE